MKQHIYILLGLICANAALATANLSVTHKLTPLEDEWLYVRASEASTLFISEHNKGNEVTCAVIEKDGRQFFTETSATGTRSFEIDRIEKNELAYEIYYKGDDFADKTLIYPFRDVDETWVIIHFTPGSENPVHFITLASNKASIPYLNE